VRTRVGPGDGAEASCGAGGDNGLKRRPVRAEFPHQVVPAPRPRRAPSDRPTRKSRLESACESRFRNSYRTNDGRNLFVILYLSQVSHAIACGNHTMTATETSGKLVPHRQGHNRFLDGQPPDLPSGQVVGDSSRHRGSSDVNADAGALRFGLFGKSPIRQECRPIRSNQQQTVFPGKA